ncbi:GNAT family N-acetyltransferase [Lentisphaera profundi]|uniref:GNAT family N-acetyltransferase n=1 Tax=Lentisphaera profundi TaxID=1658616 RepID=A0ABY7VWB0_9BACT|nr:GNAT family N-acyltransferase [Lentisphaera profundi]WDE98525.1 GNAT family N-acetyltransferase [Lentisphaera profundi]
MKTKKICIENLLEDKAIFELSAPLLNKVLKFNKLDAVYQQIEASPSSEEFIDQALDILNIDIDLNEQDIANIPKTGPVVIVSNHPFGGIDGLILLRLIKRVRPDVKIMANHFLSQIEAVNQDCIYVDAFKRNNDKNHRPIRESLQFLKNGGLLAVFPAGAVSHYHHEDHRVSDDEWNPAIFRMAKIAAASVVPVHFKGRNSLLFNTLGMIHPLIRTALLPRELSREGRKISVKVGSLINPIKIKSFKDDEQGISFLRLQTLLLNTELKKKDFDFSNTDQAPIIAAIPKDILNEEIEHLSPQSKLHSYKEYDVYCSKSQQMPQVMREIGRLREITFRRANEGTGTEIDLDEYDQHYEQLFIWNREAREIVGAYRIGRMDELGLKGVYTSNFYNFAPDFFQKYKMSLEMGRSFVSPAYQRKPYSLLLLWRGIGAYMMRNPQYRYLIGAVSVSSDYSAVSRALIAELLLSDESGVEAKQKAKLHKFNREIRRYCKMLNISNPEQLSALVRNIEPDHKDIPPLVKHYMKLGGKFCSFSVDEHFGGTLDGLIVVDLPNAPPKSLLTYLGENYSHYCDQHTSPCLA